MWWIIYALCAEFEIVMGRARKSVELFIYFGIPARSSLTVCFESARKKMTTG
jgi:hypothetical protein